MDKNAFIGTWKLVSFVLQNPDGTFSYPFGVEPGGYIFYTADGYMAVAIMAAGRPHFNSQDLMGGTIPEKASAVDTFLSYCGTYEVQGNEVVHHLEVSLFPNWTARDVRRFYRFEGRRLILSAAPQLFQGNDHSLVLVWERVGD